MFSYTLKALILALIFFVLRASGDSIDCSQPLTVNVDGQYKQFNISSLAGDQKLNLNHKYSARRKVRELRFNVCGDLHQEYIGDQEKCPQGSRACFTSGTLEQGYASIALADSTELKPIIMALPYPKEGLFIVLQGTESKDIMPVHTGQAKPQSLVITILCNTTHHDPHSAVHDLKRVYVWWRTPAGCML